MPFLCVLGSIIFTILGFAEVVTAKVRWKRGGHWGLLEARGVGSGLAAKLGEVKVGAGTVAEIHRLMKASLSIVAIEDDSVDGDGDDFHNDLDKGADECPMLQVSVNRRPSYQQARSDLTCILQTRA